MDSSRVFVKGLPPTIDEATFRKHFAYAGNITDVKLMPQRRIGYVGYTTPAEAAKSVKRLNRSFIRMSRVSVEPAKPVSAFFSVSDMILAGSADHPTGSRPVPK